MAMLFLMFGYPVTAIIYSMIAQGCGSYLVERDEQTLMFRKPLPIRLSAILIGCIIPHVIAVYAFTLYLYGGSSRPSPFPVTALYAFGFIDLLIVGLLVGAMLWASKAQELVIDLNKRTYCFEHRWLLAKHSKRTTGAMNDFAGVYLARRRSIY